MTLYSIAKTRRRRIGLNLGGMYYVPHTPTGMAILEPKNNGQNRQTVHLQFIYGSLRHVYDVHGIYVQVAINFCSVLS